MTQPITLELPLPPNILNARMHWRVKALSKIDYFKTLDSRQGAGLIPEPPRRPLTKVTATAMMFVGAEHDDDNAMARAYKLPLDWLKTRGYIVDDKRKHVRCAVPEQVVKRDGNYRVVITLSPA